MYAYYDYEMYDITFSGSNVSFSTNPLKVGYTLSSTITLIPASGYYFESLSCPAGYTVTGFSSGTSYYSNQTITITNNTHVGGGTCTVGMHARSYAATPHTTSSKVKCGHWDALDGSPGGGTCSNKRFRCDGCGTVTTAYTCSDPDGSGWGKGDHYKTVTKTTYSCPNGGTLSGTICVF